MPVKIKLLNVVKADVKAEAWVKVENSPTKIKARPAGVKDLPIRLHGF